MGQTGTAKSFSSQSSLNLNLQDSDFPFHSFLIFSLNFVFTALYPARSIVTIQSLFSNLQKVG